MNILIVHQNYPGQWREMLPRLCAGGRNKVVFLTQRKEIGEPKDHVVVIYEAAHRAKPGGWRYSNMFENMTGNGIGAAKACIELRKKGFTPDIIIGHTGWGEMTYLKEVWPKVPMVGSFEYYYIPKGGLFGFDKEFPEKPDIAYLLHSNNAYLHLNHLTCDGRHTATKWQRSTYPERLREGIEVYHEGVRTDRLKPDHASDIKVMVGDYEMSRQDKIVTYVARGLEPARGFHIMMRALPRLQKLARDARVVIIGADEIFYGLKLPEGKTFRGIFTKELDGKVDWARVHFAGRVAYGDYVRLLQLARCHVYLTAPFVLSWSLLESMALEKTIVASGVDPVREVIEDDRTGLLVDFFAYEHLAEKVARVLKHPTHYRAIGEEARRYAVATFDFATTCFPAYVRFLNGFLPQDRQIEI